MTSKVLVLLAFQLCFQLCFLALGAIAQAAQWPRSYEFIDLGGCSTDNYFHKFCMNYSGKKADWDAPSKAAVQAALDKLPYAQLDKLANIMPRPPGKIVFIRMLDGMSQAETSVLNGDTVIALRPQFFLAESTVAGVPEKLQTITHEFIHVFAHDLEQSQMWQDLANALGWRFQRGPNPIARGTKESSEAIKKMNALYTNGGRAERQEAVRIDLAFARPRGLPSLYSTVSMTEYVAELFAFLISDPDLVSVLPQGVVDVMNRNGFGFLIDAAKVAAPVKKQPRWNGAAPGSADFVGMLLVEQKPLCSGVLVRHGLILTAKSCLKPYVTRTSDQPSTGTLYPFFSFEFRNETGMLVYMDGFSMDFSLDPGDGEIAYITYEASKTSGKIQIPSIRLATATDLALVPASLFTTGFARPFKPQKMVQQWAGPCSIDSDRANHTNCPTWIGASGSPLLSRDASGAFTLWGLLTSKLELAVADGKMDAWGAYLESDYTSIGAARVIPKP